LTQGQCPHLTLGIAAAITGDSAERDAWLDEGEALLA